MMKFRLLLFVMMFTGVVTNAQEGVKFEDLTFKEALAKAKAENKLVFMDCYTSWCGPCKKMLNTVFVQKEAGDFFNPRFVNIKYDMEKGEGIELAKQFNVKSFPTFFIIRPDGSIQHKVGGAGSLNSFLGWVERGLHEETSLDFLNKQYEKGTMNKRQLLDYYWVLLCAGEKEKSKVVLEVLKGKLDDHDRLQEDYWFLTEGQPYGSSGFNFVTTHYSEFKRNVGEEKIHDYLLKNFHKVLDNEFERKGGADKKAMKNLFNQISKEWSSMDWVPDARLQNKLKLLGACVAEDSKQIVSCLEFGLDKQLVPKWNYDLWVMLSTLDFVNVKEGKVDSKRILALKTRIQGYFANSPSILKRLDPYFEKFN